MSEGDWHEFLLEFENATKDTATDDNLVLFRIGKDGAIFTAVEKSNPIKMDLRCDHLLAKTLRKEYETVLPAKQFDPKTWNSIIVTGQLSDDEVKDLVRLSYNLTAEL